MKIGVVTYRDFEAKTSSIVGVFSDFENAVNAMRKDADQTINDFNFAIKDPECIEDDLMGVATMAYVNTKGEAFAQYDVNMFTVDEEIPVDEQIEV